MTRLSLSWKAYNLQLKYPFKIATYTRASTPVVLTKLEYDGLTGYGEASLPQYLGETQDSVEAFLRKLDLSQFHPITGMQDILDYADKIEYNNTAAKASVDIALHDLSGKMLGKPWYSIWNLDKNKTPYTTYTIGMDEDNIVEKKTREAVSRFKMLKVKLGSSKDKRIIEIIRSVTDMTLLVDANQGWKDRSEVLEMAHWLKEQGVLLIEQPMDKNNLDDHAWLTQNSPLPIFADESVQRLSDLERIKGAFSGINIKLMKCTGMSEARKMLEISSSLGFKTMLGCMTETSCAISAASQLSPLADFADLDGNLLITNDCFDGVKIENGRIALNNLPGIGVTPLSEVG